MKNFKRTLAGVLTLIMALTMFAGTVSAEDTATETVADTSYTWTPYKDVPAYATTTTRSETVSTETVATADVPKESTVYEDLGTVDNGDGTVTTTIATTTVTVTDNGDGNSTVTTKEEEKATVATIPYYSNDEFAFRILSNRVNAYGFVECTDYKAKAIYSDSKDNRYATASNKNWNNESAIYPVMPEDDNDRYSQVINYGGSFYTVDPAVATRDKVMYVSRCNNDMWLEFTAPSDGLYTASGYIGEVYSGGTDGDQITYAYVKVDSNGNHINLTEATLVEAYDTNTDIGKAMQDVKVELKKGEKLVITTHQLTAGGVRKIHLSGYTVTKLDYSEADDKSTVTTNYSYKNYNYEKIYGDTFATELPKNYEKVWDMNAVRYNANGATTASAALTIDATTDLDYYSNGTLANGISAWCTNTKGGYDQYIKYDSVADTLTARVTNRLANGVLYNYGFQFIFTVPEDGDAVITAPSYIEGGNIAIRYGVKKADATAVEYVAPVSTVNGSIIMWHTMTTEGNTFNIKDLNAGDKIYLEITSSGTGNGGSRTCYLDSLNVALTTENSPADVTGDFKADATDTIFMRKHLLRKLTGNVEDLDITGDNLADLRDLVKLKKVIAGIE